MKTESKRLPFGFVEFLQRGRCLEDCWHGRRGLRHAYVIFLPSGGHPVNMFGLNRLLLQLLTGQGSCAKIGNPENPDLKSTRVCCLCVWKFCSEFVLQELVEIGQCPHFAPSVCCRGIVFI